MLINLSVAQRRAIVKARGELADFCVLVHIGCGVCTVIAPGFATLGVRNMGAKRHADRVWRDVHMLTEQGIQPRATQLYAGLTMTVIDHIAVGQTSA